MRAVGIDIVFDMALDGRAWAGPVSRGRYATAGELWTGPQGLLDRLELQLGLTAVHATPLERVVDMSRELERTAGFWSRSTEVDPLGSARRILEERDRLALCGWRGEPVGERLRSLWAVTESTAAGVPDRLRRVIAALQLRPIDISSIQMFEPMDTLPPLWRETLAVLAARGVPVVSVKLPVVAAGGDLGASRDASFRPSGDGSLQLLRTQGPLDAADAVAGTLAAAPDLERTIVVNPDHVLDAALTRYGLPSVGAGLPPPASATLVRLCVETAFHPMDIGVLHGLISSDPGPVPRGMAWALIRVLAKFPARGSAEWKRELAASLESLEEEAREAVAARVAALVDPVAQRDAAIPIELIGQRMRVLAAWARGREAKDRSLADVAIRAMQLAALAERRGRPQLRRRDLLQLCEELNHVVVDGPPGQVGLVAVADPAAVLAPARAVIWWGFTRDRIARRAGPRLTQAERGALRAAGITPPDPEAEALHAARRWRRALALATESAILVCPYTDAVGDRAHPHPLWDELVAGVPRPALVDRLRTSRMRFFGIGADRERAVPRTIPVPAVGARTAAIAIGAEQTASSIEQLLGCSFAYIVRRVGKLRRRLAGAPPEPSPLLYGNIAHHVIARTFECGADAGEIFDAELPQLAESLLLPDHHAERVMLRRSIVASVALLARTLGDAGAHRRGVEHPVAGRVGSTEVTGRADFLLEHDVIDFKWGTSIYRDQLRTGSAVQLAIYAALTGASGAAYLGLRDQRLFATRGCALPNVIMPGPYSVEEMLQVAVAAMNARALELAEGRLTVPGALADPSRSRIVNGVLELTAPCEHCDLDGLCGRRGRR